MSNIKRRTRDLAGNRVRAAGACIIHSRQEVELAHAYYGTAQINNQPWSVACSFSTIANLLLQE